MAGVPIESDGRELSLEDWLGQKVVPKHRDFRLPNGQGDPFHDKKLLSHYVLDVNGLSLTIMTSQGDAWVPADQVVPLDKAVAFFSDTIKANPRISFPYFMRAKVLLDVSNDPDKALADLNESIRLDPKNAASYRNRADAWSEKGDPDKAITDDSEAIRLDPKDAGSYQHRSEMWGAKKDYDKALADVNEAIRLDPRDDDAFALRGDIWLSKEAYDQAIADYTEAIRVYRRRHEVLAGRPASQYGNPKSDRAGDDPAHLAFSPAAPTPLPSVLADLDPDRFLDHGRELALAYVAPRERLRRPGGIRPVSPAGAT